MHTLFFSLKGAFLLGVLAIFLASDYSFALNEDYLGEVNRDGRSGWDLDYGSETEGDEAVEGKGEEKGKAPSEYDSNDFFTGDYDPIDRGVSGVVTEDNKSKEEDLKPAKSQDPKREVKSLMELR